MKIDDVFDIINKIFDDSKTKPIICEEPKKSDITNSDHVEVLTAEKISELRWMTASQLEVIYHKGKRKVRIADSPEAYKQLRHMTPSQLAAIFGE